MTVRVAVPDLISNSYFPAVAAVQLGLFAKQGIDASIELLFPVPKAMEELREGRLDFVVGAAHAPLYAFPDWEGCRLLATVARNMYWFLVVRADLRVAPGDLEAIRGLRIGAAPGPVDGLKRMLAVAGIDPETDVTIGPIPPAAGTDGSRMSFGISAARAVADGTIDGFWANGMGTAVAVRNGWGTVVLDVRRDGPAWAQPYTFPALVATERTVRDRPDVALGAVRAIVEAQQLLKADPDQATVVGEALFPAQEAELIAELIRRDLPFYQPAITPYDVAELNGFARTFGLLHADVPYDRVVATEFAAAWQD